MEDLKKAIYKAKRKYHVSRQRLTLPPGEGQRSGKVLEDSKKLSFYELRDGSEIYLKDLGPQVSQACNLNILVLVQVSYKAVFFWEYFGPLMVYPIFYFLPGVYWWNVDQTGEKDLVQSLALVFWSFHYMKRILETFFVHK